MQRELFMMSAIPKPLITSQQLLGLLFCQTLLLSPLAAQPHSEDFERRQVNPAELYRSKYYTQAVSTKGGLTHHISGQWAYEQDGTLVGEGDLLAQSLKAFENLGAVLAACQATPSDVVKINIYVVGYQAEQPEHIAAVDAGMTHLFGSRRDFASTLVGVASLARPGMLFEVEAIAITRH